MTQLYVGNLSEDGDEKAIRSLFGRYGNVREVLMKNGYAFVEMESAMQADQTMRDLNGTDILGHPMIVEPSHQQRLSSRRRSQLGVVEVANIPTHMTLEAIEKFFSQAIGSVVKIEIEDSTPSDFGAKRILISFETMEQAQRAAAMYTGDEQTLKCTIVDDFFRASLIAQKNGRSRSSPNSPSKGNTEFPLRILVPSDMVGAIIGKDGATIRGITQLTKARVDVHRRENVGSVEKAITIIGTPEACTEACYQIMKIMQNELLMTSGLLENGKHHHFEPLPVVPLKILAHNELVGRVIGKGGNTLKRIMAESGTKITISKLKDLTAYNMERTVTILGTIDNCKKAESLISAKLRASYESDMNQFMQTPPGVESNGSPPHSSLTTKFLPQKTSSMQAQSLPPTPTAVRTFTDFSQEHTRLTTLHGSTGALEVNGLGGFYGPKQQGAYGGNYRAGYEPNGLYPPKHGGGYVYPERDPIHPGDMGNGCGDEDLNDVFTNLAIHEPYSGPAYGHGRSRRSSAPVQHGNNLWNSDVPMGMHNGYGGYPHPPPNHMQWGAPPPPPPPPNNSHSVHGSVSSIWSPTFISPPESEISSFPDSDGSQSFNGFSPIYSPISGNFDDAVSSAVTTSGTSLVSAMTTAASSIAISHRDSLQPVSVVQASLGGIMTTDCKTVLAPPRPPASSSISPSRKTTEPPSTNGAFMSTYSEEESVFLAGQPSALEQLINEGVSQWQVATHT